jgi:hypothetical protein
MLAALRVKNEWPERTVFAFAISLLVDLRLLGFCCRSSAWASITPPP